MRTRLVRLSRRSFLAGGLALAGGFGALFVAEQHRDRLREKVRHRTGPPTLVAPEPEILETLVSCLGAFFGRDLTADDRRELSGRMIYAATRDSGWAEEYVAAANLLDRGAANHGFSSFLAADQETQVRVTRDLRLPLRGFWAEIRLGTSETDWLRERMRVSTMRHLNHLYRHSGVPWRQRGFSTWPGVPDKVPAYESLRHG